MGDERDLIPGITYDSVVETVSFAIPRKLPLTMTEATLFLPGLSPVGGKDITATFDAGQLSSDGGVLILREIEKRLGMAAMLSACVPDARDQSRVIHTHADMIRARVFAIASGYEDCDDLDALRIDPAFKMACGRLPETGKDLMSQPTLSRLENAPSWRALARMALGMIDLFCASFSRVPGRIVLDIDDTDDPAHGQQELILFNAHSGGYCFQPMHIFEAGSGKSVLSLLRPGKRPSGEEIAQVLRHVIDRIRRNWPRVEIMVRGDSHYTAPEVLDLLEERRCSYILGLSTNARLAKMAHPWAEDAATRLALAKKKRAALPSDRLPGWQLVEGAQDHRPRRGHRHGQRRPLRGDEPARLSESALRESLLRIRTHGEHDQGHETLHALRSHLLPSLGGQSVPAYPAHGRLLAAARVEGRCPQALAMAHGDFRDAAARLLKFAVRVVSVSVLRE